MSPSRATSGSAAGARPVKPTLAPADKLKGEIQAVLTDDLRSDEHRLGHGRYDGFAYPRPRPTSTSPAVPPPASTPCT